MKFRIIVLDRRDLVFNCYLCCQFLAYFPEQSLFGSFTGLDLAEITRQKKYMGI